jgi:flagellar biosynthesis/type III secretory pathway M-ring protein FliF/YscJ
LPSEPRLVCGGVGLWNGLRRERHRRSVYEIRSGAPGGDAGGDACLVGFFAFVMLRMSQPAMSVLFSDLSQQDVSAILKDLDTRGIKYELRSDGQTVLVAKADVPRLRLDLASKGIPSGGGVGYEIFDKGDAFSSTSFVQNINHLRALEGELSRTIRSISRVQAARVHLVIPRSACSSAIARRRAPRSRSS